MVTTPTALQLKARYPEFSEVSDTRVDIFIAEALRFVDDSWREVDQTPAILALSCHNMASEGEPYASTSEGSDPSATNLKDGMEQVVYYDQGVGTEGFWDRIFVGLFGMGLSHNIQEAYEYLTEVYNDGDELFLFGFSRGAFTGITIYVCLLSFSKLTLT